jgi:hypothetical protein
MVLSCEEPELNDPVQAMDDLSMKIAKAGPNPFTAENMKKAIDNLVERKKLSSGKTLTEVPSTTHNYVRFAPQNEDQLITLHNWGYDLYDVPLDMDITTSGEYYQDPSLPPDAITYQYTLVPSNYSLPSSVPYSILYQVFLFDEYAGDEQDPEYDPWAPDPGNGVCYDEFGAAYLCGTDPRAYLRTSVAPQKPEDLYRKATTELIKAGINLKELYNEAMSLVGLKDEMIPVDSPNGKTKAVNPYGYVRVEDNSIGSYVPVKNVTVKARRWFKLAQTQTDANGYFYINKSYRSKANIVLKFRNNDITIRGISGLLKFWEYAQALEKECGLYSESGLMNMNIQLAFHSNADTYGALQWAAAHGMNTHYESKQYVQANNIAGSFPPMNIWISSAVTQAASAPMLRSIAGTSAINQAINYLLPSLASNIKKLVENWLPDVTLRLQGSGTTTRNADRINNIFFHEFAHGLHYNKVGNNYWASYIAYIVTNGGYGSKTTSGSGRVAVGESWGFFVGSTFNRTKYAMHSTISEKELNFLERQRNDNNNAYVDFNPTLGYSRGWIPWGMLHDLMDIGEPSITLIDDQVSNYSVGGIFRGFHSGSDNVYSLKDAILVNNSNSQAVQVNTLSASYGW